jgi:nicotinamidase/pyrazinamidase
MNSSDGKDIELKRGDALLAVDIQNDFLPGGSLAVPGGNEIIPVVNRLVERFQAKGFPIFATGDCHPPDHCSFHAKGGPWPLHCVEGTDGALFPPELHLPERVEVIYKATSLEKDAYSGFEGTDLDKRLKAAGVGRLVIGGLATDYCVVNTVKDALKHGYQVLLAVDAIRAVNVQPGDGERAVEEMVRLGARPVEAGRLG